MIRLEHAGESGIIIYFGDAISESSAARVKAACSQIRLRFTDYILDLIPSYTSLLVLYDADKIDYLSIMSRLRLLLDEEALNLPAENDSRLIQLPVYYGAEVALDLDFVSHHTGLSQAQVIALHSQQEYRVYAIGFAPGFAYLGLTDDRLRVSRKQTPRLKVPRGSVALADNQTAIYPSVSPGGWQVIGRTPNPLVDWDADPITPFDVGDRVQFRAIERDEFIELGGSLDEL